MNPLPISIMRLRSTRPRQSSYLKQAEVYLRLGLIPLAHSAVRTAARLTAPDIATRDYIRTFALTIEKEMKRSIPRYVPPFDLGWLRHLPWSRRAQPAMASSVEDRSGVMTAYAFLHVAISFLIIGSLALMVARIYLPWVRQPKEAVLFSYVVPFRLRVRMQRANIYGLTVLLVLGTVGHWIAPVALLLAIGSMVADFGDAGPLYPHYHGDHAGTYSDLRMDHVWRDGTASRTRPSRRHRRLAPTRRLVATPPR